MKKLLTLSTCVILLGMLANPAFSQDSDGDGIPDIVDNCPSDSNPLQEDSYPPQGNGCGDACECEGNFNGDQAQDAIDGALFRRDEGTGPGNIPCTNENPCYGDFTCDGDVDDEDGAFFQTDFGRSIFNDPCPTTCVRDPWCVYVTTTTTTTLPDVDHDGIPDNSDNCPNMPNGPDGGTCTAGDFCAVTPCDDHEDCGANCSPTQPCCDMGQIDSDGDGIGDACEFCEANFDCDFDVDGTDAGLFKTDYGRSIYLNPCTNSASCKGDFDCDHDVDGTDAALFKSDFGRSEYYNVCPSCEICPWCVYP